MIHVLAYFSAQRYWVYLWRSFRPSDGSWWLSHEGIMIQRLSDWLLKWWIPKCRSQGLGDIDERFPANAWNANFAPLTKLRRKSDAGVAWSCLSDFECKWVLQLKPLNKQTLFTWEALAIRGAFLIYESYEKLLSQRENKRKKKNANTIQHPMNSSYNANLKKVMDTFVSRIYFIWKDLEFIYIFLLELTYLR